MLKISKRQMTVIDAGVEAAYARDMAAYLRQEHAEDVARLSDEELERRAAAAIERAARYGLTWDTSITAFVAIMISVGPRFDEHPAIRAVMTDESVPPNLRIDALWDRTTDDDWEEAAARGDEGFWSGAGSARAGEDVGR